MKKALWSILVILVWTTFSSLAQECPEYVAQALANVANQCSNLTRNELCYGNVELNVVTDADVIFENPGDVINVGDIESLSLTGSESGEWGLALMNLQASLPDGLPGQNVTVLLFGNVDFGVEDSLEAFYFNGGIGQPGCAEAPNGIILQSPLGHTVQMTINGAEIQFGSTVLLERNSNGMSLSTLAGMASIASNGVLQMVVQGTKSTVALDENSVAVGVPRMAQSIDAQNLTPMVQAVNESGIMLPTYEDSAANPFVQTLIEEGWMQPLSETTPLVAVPENEIPQVVVMAEEIVFNLRPRPNVVVAEEIVFLLPARVPAEEITLMSGRWVQVEQNREVYGECLDPQTDGDNGGGVIERGDGKPICSLEGNRGIIFGDSMLERLSTNVYGSEYRGERPNFGTGEGTIQESLSWHYRIISPTRIQFIFQSSEEDGCTVVMTIIYELNVEDSSACDGVEVNANANTEEDEDIVVYDVVAGSYSSDDLYSVDCDATLSESFENITIGVNADSVDLTAGDSVYNVPAMGSVYLFYEDNVTISVIAMDEDEVSVSYGNGACMMAGNYRAE